MRKGFSFITLLVVGSSLGLVGAACGSSSGQSGFGDNGGDNGGSDASGGNFDGDNPSLDGSLSHGQDSGDASYSTDAFWAMDPPYMTCGPDGSVDVDAAPPGGTPECPDDKNREGCPCSPGAVEGTMAACWPGLRSERNVGVCKDGVTTCTLTDETQLAWGPCVNAVLPTPGATMGAAACKCFSSGQWAIANLSPCFYGTDGSGGASSTTDNGSVQCFGTQPPALPTSDWSTDTVTADCVGTFTLCYTLKAGNGSSPQPTDCTVAQSCTTSYYPVANQVTTFPDLPAWTTSTSAENACAAQFATSGGYGEMSVTGESELCEAIGDVNDAGVQSPYVFNTVTYCPLSCSTDPSGAGCANCMSGGGGTF
jgi:hypothetical protein